MEKIDARGKACPQPVLLAKQAVDRGIEIIEVLVDGKIPLENVTKFFKSQGYRTENGEGPEGSLFVRGFKETSAEARSAEPIACETPRVAGEDYALLLLSRTIGHESVELGELLMKSFLGTLVQRSVLPKTIALMNGGVLLALPENSESDTLKELEAKGVSILVCGTCTKHFGITERVCVGTISNMFEITEAIFSSSKPLVLG